MNKYDVVFVLAMIAVIHLVVSLCSSGRFSDVEFGAFCGCLGATLAFLFYKQKP
jgi:uncharacterized membrane protein YjjP (DUF1212 family)